jgi:sulfate transport system permease protein
VIAAVQIKRNRSILFGFGLTLGYSLLYLGLIVLIPLAAMLFLVMFLILPLAAVFMEALAKGWSMYVAALTEPDALAARRLTLLAAGTAVSLNVVFGVAAAWAIAKFDSPGKSAC